MYVYGAGEGPDCHFILLHCADGGYGSGGYGHWVCSDVEIGCKMLVSRLVNSGYITDQCALVVF